MSHNSKACCEIPPVVSEGYKEKGEYKTINGMKTYVTGPSDASKALILVYDIFGFFPQTIQGADILAYSDKTHKYQVFMPDFFDGEPADISWYPPKTDEQGAKLGKFFETKAAPPNTLNRIKPVLAEAEQANPNIKSWGAMGYCWGAKIVSLISQRDTKIKAGAQVHPAMVTADDAKGCKIPMCMLASKDELADDIKAYESALTTTKHVETFDTQVHGWMAARADLADPKVKAEYERGYSTVLSFFHDNL